MYEFGKYEISFDYSIKYGIDVENVEITWQKNDLPINGAGRKTIGDTPLPDTVLIYYSGHNTKVTNLVQAYDESFKKAIKRADIKDTRKFIGIGNEYKQLLLAILLMQKMDKKARQFICSKLGIKSVDGLLKLTLKRPYYAESRSFNIENNDESDRFWRPEGITAEFLK